MKQFKTKKVETVKTVEPVKNIEMIDNSNSVEKSKLHSESTKDFENPKPIIQFVEQLNALEKIAYDIAKTRLKSSFDIEKSIGFKQFNPL